MRTRSLIMLCSTLVVAILAMPTVVSAIAPGGSTAPEDGAIYVPVVPCKVFAGVKLDGLDFNDIRQLDITAVSGAGQGEDACAATAAPAGAVAASINLIAQDPLARGNLSVGPFGGNLESVLNYSVESNLNNATEFTVELDVNGHIGLQAKGSGTNGFTDVITAKGVLLGYYVTGTDLYESFDRTIVVGGDQAALTNGAALLTAVAAANANASSSEPWLIKLEPGLFDLGSASMQLGSYVSVEGSGHHATKINGTATYVIQPGSFTSVANLYVAVDGGSADRQPFRILDKVDVAILNVHVFATGTLADGIEMEDSVGVVLDAVVIVAGDGATSLNGGDVTIRNSRLTGASNALNMLGGSGDAIVHGSSLTATKTGAEAVDFQGGGGHTITIYNSVITSEAGETYAAGTATDVLSVYNSHIDAQNLPPAFTGTLTCAQISTPAPTGPNNICPNAP